jgi:hypothetical protein
MTSSPAALEDDFEAGRTQLLWSSPSLALSSPRLRSAVPLVCSVREGVAYYHSVLVVARESAITSAFGFVRTIALSAGPRLSYASMRARYPVTMA